MCRSAGGGTVPAPASGSHGGAAQLPGALPAPGDGAEEGAEEDRGSQGRDGKGGLNLFFDMVGKGR